MAALLSNGYLGLLEGGAIKNPGVGLFFSNRLTLPC
jgi:hypothetical protein